MTDSKKRFSNRVDAYVKYRPSYPEEAIDYLFGVVGLHAHAEVADVGAGTGIFSRLLLERGSFVTAVEPNPDMRQAAHHSMDDESTFRIVEGSAEQTGLPDCSIDFIVCAQAFHWFDQEAAQTEFRRILKQSGKVVLIWNSRITRGTAFLEEYERLLLAYATDYAQVNHRNLSPDTLVSFFKQDTMKEARFMNRQIFDFDGLKGRLLSSSYSPVEGDLQFEQMMTQLRSLFERNQREGKVFFDYETEVYWGEV